MNDNFLLEKNNISGILDGICTLRTCQGLDAANFTLKESDEIIKEMFTFSNDENSTKKVFRVMNCQRIINFRNHPSANICLTCKSTLKINKNKLMTCTKTSPLAHISNSHGYTACTDTSKKVLNENVNTCTDKTIPSSMTKLNKTVNVEIIESKELHRTSDGVVPTCPIALSDAYGSKNNITLSNTTVHVSEFPKSTLLSQHDEGELPGLTVSDSDSNDIEVIFNEISKDCSSQILEFLMSQKKALSNHPNGRCWNANIIRLCLTLWCRSPQCYTDLRDSGFLILPSQQILQIYKGRFHQKAGLNKELLHWMKIEAMHRNLPPEGYDGGLVLDEMSIQSDLQFYSKK
ncbi:unnamed protein product [Mytilus edulis]|uniref:Uncharacterized protein n=1 Tax=Mytilus edulis TaxID=6550 RepID=A0A8S3Q1G0_MYTED|nr:unnamed protein product [Mytilus edulis]